MMKNTTRIPALATLLAALASAPAAFAQDSWKEHHSDDCGSTASFPGSPESRTMKMPSQYGNLDQKMSILQLPKPNQTFYATSCTDYPKSAQNKTPDEQLDIARDTSVTRVKGKVRSETKIKLGDVPGRELVIDVPGELVITTRYFMNKDRIHQVMVLTKKAQIEAADSARFLDSFKLDK